MQGEAAEKPEGGDTSSKIYVCHPLLGKAQETPELQGKAARNGRE